MSTPAVSTKPSEENFEQEFKDLGRRLGLLLSAADLPQEVKEAWAVLIPEMTLEQIDKLMVILERYVTSGIAKEFDSFKKDLLKIQQAHEEKVQQSNDKAMSQLDDLEKIINDAG